MRAALAFVVALVGCLDHDEDCCSQPVVCGDGVCDPEESLAACPVDCDASLTIHDASAWPIAAVYLLPCGTTDGGANQLATPLESGAEITVTGIMAGCYGLRAISSDGSEAWERDEQALFAVPNWIWTLTTSDARTPS